MGLRVAGPSAVTVRRYPQAGKELLATGLVATGVLVDDALVVPRQGIAQQLLARTGKASAARLDVIRVRAQPRQLEALADLQRFVGVDRQQVVGPAARELEGLGTVVREVDPWALD